jgi:hypothetical protein
MKLIKQNGVINMTVTLQNGQSIIAQNDLFNEDSGKWEAQPSLVMKGPNRDTLSTALPSSKGLYGPSAGSNNGSKELSSTFANPLDDKLVQTQMAQAQRQMTQNLGTGRFPLGKDVIYA